MGFTIDMVTGNVTDITNNIEAETDEEISSMSTSIGEVDSLTEEKMLPVSESEKPAETFIIPEFIINRDIDSFIEDVS